MCGCTRSSSGRGRPAAGTWPGRRRGRRKRPGPRMTSSPWSGDAARGFVGPGLEHDLRVRVRAPSPGTDRGCVPGSFDEHRFAGVIAVTPHGGAHRRDVVAAFAGAARDGVPAASLERVTDLWAPDGAGGCGRGPDGTAIGGAGEPPSPRRSVHGRSIRPTTRRGWRRRGPSTPYRARWGVERAPEPLGTDRPLSSLPAARLADHLRVARQLDAARVSSGGVRRRRWSSDWTGDDPISGRDRVLPSRRRPGPAPDQPDRATASVRGPGVSVTSVTSLSGPSTSAWPRRTAGHGVDGEARLAVTGSPKSTAGCVPTGPPSG